MVKITNYPNNFVTIVLATFYLLSLNLNIQQIINGFVVDIPFKVSITSFYSLELFEKFLLMCVTLAFYYFGDFNHNKKEKIAKSTTQA